MGRFGLGAFGGDPILGGNRHHGAISYFDLGCPRTAARSLIGFRVCVKCLLLQFGSAPGSRRADASNERDQNGGNDFGDNNGPTKGSHLVQDLGVP